MMSVSQTATAAASRVATESLHLSEAELLHQYPALAATLAVLFLFGLVADACLAAWYMRRRRAGTAASSAIFQVAAKPWGLTELAAGTAILLAALGGGNLLFALMLRLVPEGDDHALAWSLLGDMAVRAGILVGADAFFRRRGVDWLQAVGVPGQVPARACALGALFFLAAIPPLTVLFALVHAVYALFGSQPQTQPIAAMFVLSESWVVPALIGSFALIVAPFFEEVFFRGFAYPALKQQFGVVGALIAVSAAFALVHFHGPSLLPLFALALALGLAYELSGSLLAPMLMHMLFNALNLGMLTFVRLQQ